MWIKLSYATRTESSGLCKWTRCKGDSILQVTNNTSVPMKRRAGWNGTFLHRQDQKRYVNVILSTHHTHVIAEWRLKGFLYDGETRYCGWSSVTVLGPPSMLSKTVTDHWQIAASSFRTLDWELANLACSARKGNKWILAKLVQSLWPLT